MSGVDTVVVSKGGQRGPWPRWFTLRYTPSTTPKEATHTHTLQIRVTSVHWYVSDISRPWWNAPASAAVGYHKTQAGECKIKPHLSPLSSVWVILKKGKNTQPLLLSPPFPLARLKIHKIYWIGVEIPKYMQFDQVGIKSVILLVNKGWWRCGSIALTPTY